MRLALGNAIPGMDSLVKLRTLADRWEFLFAADDIGLVRPIAELARQRLRPFSDRADASHIIAAIESAYQTVRSNVIFNRYIRQYGYKSMDDFKEKPGFNAEIISSLMREIDSFDLGVQLLVYGFDDKGHAHFLEVRNPGEAISRDDLDFWAIGSGFRMAMATLTSRSTQSDTLEAMIYRCCEAKFVSEYAQDVGKTTSVYVKDKEGMRFWLMPEDVEEIRRIYEQNRFQPIPDEAREKISKTLQPQQQTRDRIIKNDASGGGS